MSLSYTHYFCLQVYDDQNGVTNRELRALASGPKSKFSLWKMWFINGYKFHTKTWSHGKQQSIAVYA